MGHTCVGVRAPYIGELVKELCFSLVCSFLFFSRGGVSFRPDGLLPPVPPPVTQCFRGGGGVCLACTMVRCSESARNMRVPHTRDYPMFLELITVEYGKWCRVLLWWYSAPLRYKHHCQGAFFNYY